MTLGLSDAPRVVDFVLEQRLLASDANSAPVALRNEAGTSGSEFSRNAASNASNKTSGSVEGGAVSRLSIQAR